MFADALREALCATRDAWDLVDDEYPDDETGGKSAVLLGLDNAILELEDALRSCCIEVPE